MNDYLLPKVLDSITYDLQQRCELINELCGLVIVETQCGACSMNNMVINLMIPLFGNMTYCMYDWWNKGKCFTI